MNEVLIAFIYKQTFAGKPLILYVFQFSSIFMWFSVFLKIFFGFVVFMEIAVKTHDAWTSLRNRRARTKTRPFGRFCVSPETDRLTHVRRTSVGARNSLTRCFELVPPSDVNNKSNGSHDVFRRNAFVLRCSSWRRRMSWKVLTVRRGFSPVCSHSLCSLRPCSSPVLICFGPSVVVVFTEPLTRCRLYGGIVVVTSAVYC